MNDVWHMILCWLNTNRNALEVIAAVWVLYTWRKSQMQKESELLQKLIDQIRSGDVREFIDMCDYETPWYGQDTHKAHDDKNAFKIDHVLTTLSGLCYMRESGLISRKAFAFFEYDFEILFSDSQVIDYMYNLYHNAKKERMSFPYECLLNYGYKRKLIRISKSTFKDPLAYLHESKLHKNLEFE